MTNNAINTQIPIEITKGGTGVTSATSTPTAGAFAAWDPNANLQANRFVLGYTTTATAAGTTTLDVTSTGQQYFTGATTQTVVMPVATTVAVRDSWYIVNNSTGVVTVQSSGANTIQVMQPGTTLLITCILSSGTTAASWSTSYKNASPVNKVVTQVFTSTGTYTPTTGMVYCTEEVVGGGGGGGGSTGGAAGTSSAGCGGGGGGYARKTLTAAQVGATATVTINNGGTAGSSPGGNGGTGGTCSIANTGSGTLTISATGGDGGHGDGSSATIKPNSGGAGGTGGIGSSGDFNCNGGPGGTGIGFGPVAIGLSGNGGNSVLGGGAIGFPDGSASGAGITGGVYGGGGSGSTSSTASAAGGAGAKGIVIVTEFISI